MAKTRLEEIREIRLEKLNKLREMGVNPYPAKLDMAIISVDRAKDSMDKNVSVAGRLWGFREHGNITFGDLKDESGNIQVFFQKKNLGDKFKILKLLDIGDIMLVSGKVFKTQAGEITIDVSSFQVLTKSLRPIPSTWEGLKDTELRHRKRYLDLMMNDNVKEAFRMRGKTLLVIRNFLDEKGFLETEVPTLQPVAGGANATPFITHLEALHQDYYLRIAPELYLKRLLVGGYEKVYDMGKNFRNEGFSMKHNPEYTLLELYQAYADYNVIMNLAEELIISVASKVLGRKTINFKDNEISLKTPWKKIKMRDAILEKSGVDIDSVTDKELREYLLQEKIEMSKTDDRGNLIDKLFSSKVEPTLIQPTFVIDLPIEVSPLAKKLESKDGYVQRFELYIGGFEVANAYSELNDPIDQKARFIEQARKKEEGVEETHPIDDDYVEALEYGMPPAGGIGFGIDRLVLLFTSLPNIREVILFPTLKPEALKENK